MKPLIALGALAFAGASILPASAATLGHMRRLDSTTGLSGGVATLTKAFPSGFVTDMGVAPASAPVRLTIGLTLRNAAMINPIIARQNTPGDSLYQKPLTEAQTEAMFSPTTASVQAVESYLSSNGFTGISATPDNELVQATGTVATANAAFGVAEHSALYAGKAVLINSQPALVPAALGGLVRAVLGVSTVPARANVVQRKAGASCVVNPANNVCTLNDFTPRGFWRVYNASGANNGGSLNPTYNSGANTEIAIFAEGILTQVVKDLRIQEHLYQIPQAQYQVIQENSTPQTDTSGADEFDIDTQSSSGIAGYVKKLDIFDALSLSDADLDISYNQFKTLNTAKAASASFGGCDYLELVAGSLAVSDADFAMAAMHGQTVFASSGDSGAACFSPMNGVPAGLPGAEYPGDSPYVISVGGTSLFATPDNFYQGEIVWDAGGGSTSAFEPAPSWTKSASTYAATGMRAVPDIAMDADPNVSGADTTVAGASNIYGGTSLASPLALGVWARIETQHNNTILNAGPVLYKEFGDDYSVTSLAPPGYFTNTVGGFNDVLVGVNGYPATPGYDLGSGLGTLDIAKQIKHIND